MGLFSRKKSDNQTSIVRCDEVEYLIWKYPNSGTIAAGTPLSVKDTEVAVLVGVSQNDCAEGSFNGVTAEPLNSVYFINLSGSNVVRFAVPYFGVNDPRFPDLNVPVAVRGSLNFNIEDYKGFMRMHRLVGFDMEQFQKKIKDAVVKYIKAVISNTPTDYGIPVVQLEKRILDIGDILLRYLKQRLAVDFAVNVRAVDINAIECDTDDENYKQLRILTQGQAAELSQTQHQINLETMKAQSSLNIESMTETQRQDLTDRGEKMRINRDLGERAGKAHIEELQKSGRMGMMGGQPVGGFNPGGVNVVNGINMVKGNPMAPQIGQGSSINMGGTNQPQMPPPMPQVSVYVAIGGQQQGPFNFDLLKQMVKTGGLTPQTLVWKEGLANWTPAQQVPELASLFNQPQVPPVPPTVPPAL